MRISKKQGVAATLVCALVATVGCGGKPKPEGMPELIPATIVVTQDGAPLTDATVTLVDVDGNCKWAVGGKTDAKGRAALRTHGDYVGVPEGVFKVGVTKVDIQVKEGAVDEEGNPLQPTPEQLKNPALLDARFVETTSVVPAEYEDAQNSPLEVTFSKSTKEAAVDIPTP